MIAPANWCSPSNRQPGCSPSMHLGEELCKPLSRGADTSFRRLQAAVGMLLARDGEPRLKVDGKLGVETVGAVNLYISPGARDCNELAANADVIAAQLEKMPQRLPDAVALPMPKRSGFPRWLLAVGVAVVVIGYNQSRPKSKRWF